MVASMASLSSEEQTYARPPTRTQGGSNIKSENQYGSVPMKGMQQPVQTDYTQPPVKPNPGGVDHYVDFKTPKAATVSKATSPPDPGFPMPSEQRRIPATQTRVSTGGSFDLSKRLTRTIRKAPIPLIEGYLEKKGDVGLVKTWKKRFFSLVGEEQRLYYYKNDLKKEAIGFISLDREDGYHGISSGDARTPGGHFQINTAKRVWYLKAPTPQLMEKWVDTCMSCVTPLERPNRNSV
jgi:hypothetical protein